MIRSSVDLPRPLGPMIATRSPRRTSSDRSVSTRFSPYDLLTPASSSTSRPLGRSGTTLNMRRAPRAVGQLGDLDLLDLLEAALRLRGLGVLGAEALDPGPLAGDLLLGARDGGLRPRARGLLLDDRLRVGAGVERDGPVVDVQRVAGDVVEEALVVRDDHRAAGVAGQELLQPADGEDVEVVGRLVEQQHVDAAHQHLRQEHAQLEPARQRRQRRAVKRASGSPAPRAPRWRAPPACSRRARRRCPRDPPAARRRRRRARRSGAAAPRARSRRRRPRASRDPG